MQRINSIELKKIEINDFDDYYTIRSEKHNLYWTGYDKKPNYEEFKKHFENRIKDPQKDIYILRVEGVCIGALNIDFYKNHAAIGYSILSKFTQQGYASLIVRMAKVIIKNIEKSDEKIEEIIAWINQKNQASIRVAEKCGYRKVDSENRIRFKHQEKYLLYKLKL